MGWNVDISSGNSLDGGSSPQEPDGDVPPFLLRGLARGIDLVLHLALLEASFRISRHLPAEGLLLLSEATLGQIDTAVGLLALVLYPVIAEAIGGATVGKLLTRLQVVDVEGPRVSARSALRRNLALPVDGFLFGLVAYSASMRSPLQQRVGDGWAGTRVVWARNTPRARATIGAVAGLAATLGLLVGSYLLAR